MSNLGRESERQGDEPSRNRCDYCRLPCPEGPVTAEIEGREYGFCSQGCRNAIQESDRVFTEYHGYRRFHTGVSTLDATLPEGFHGTRS
ncbi:hypothetical protein VB773_15035 [Haloarculaceae archaeon H-GB2-1]|nr:hypothetical protein [Haloarculaceae archaeon H-GB11]MEA5408749.1 hypothetical protein [Haloarculaceae archaeon H-GB2-1]